jgi:shikimate dehydrogenase
VLTVATLTGVVGQPVTHSRSPAMHNAAFRALGLHWRYLALPVSPEHVEGTLRALAPSGYRGVNVTVPHKLAALAVADRASPAAAEIGAANTLTFDDGIEADNTDAPGLLAALGASPAGLSAVVLGAGGSARAAAWALRHAGAAEVSVWNRTAERADRLAADLGVRVLARPEAGDLLVNATSVGLDPAVPEADALAALVVDLVYGAGQTPVGSWAARGGARVVDGIEVLVQQGALSFERWTGIAPPLEVMRSAAREADFSSSRPPN